MRFESSLFQALRHRLYLLLCKWLILPLALLSSTQHTGIEVVPQIRTD